MTTIEEAVLTSIRDGNNKFNSIATDLEDLYEGHEVYDALKNLTQRGLLKVDTETGMTNKQYVIAGEPVRPKPALVGKIENGNGNGNSHTQSGRGKKSKVTAEAMEHLGRQCKTVSEAARALGVTEGAIYVAFGRDKAIKAAWERGKAQSNGNGSNEARQPEIAVSPVIQKQESAPQIKSPISETPKKPHRIGNHEKKRIVDSIIIETGFTPAPLTSPRVKSIWEDFVEKLEPGQSFILPNGLSTSQMQKQAKKGGKKVCYRRVQEGGQEKIRAYVL